jgi:molybdate transport system substrate-binding protein
MQVRLRIAAAAVATLALVSCSSTGSTSGSATGTAPAPSGTTSTVTGGITVFAAASLTEAFTRIGKDFEAANPDTTISFNFGASSTLAAQIAEKAPADVFASASSTTMDTVVASGAVSSATVFAVNTMAIATPTDPVVPVTSLADLAEPGIKLAVCEQAVPCGAAAQTLLTDNELTVTPSSEEIDVKAVLAKVQLGEVDAGIVYVTDIRAAGDTVTGVEIPADQNVTTDYPIATVADSPNPDLAAAFVAYVLSAPAQQALSEAGFGSP